MLTVGKCVPLSVVDWYVRVHFRVGSVTPECHSLLTYFHISAIWLSVAAMIAVTLWSCYLVSVEPIHFYIHSCA